MTGRHAVEEDEQEPGAFDEYFCEQCRPIFERFRDAMVKASNDNPCPPVWYFQTEGREFICLRIGTHESTWEVRTKVTEDMMAGPNEIGAWVHWSYCDDDEMTHTLAAAEHLHTRV